jgi:hypothetical protein
MNWSNPEDLAKFVNAVTPSVVGGAFSIAGVLVLFWLQQRAQRKADRVSRRIDAVEHLMETLENARQAFRGGVSIDADHMGRMLANSWRFAWLLEAKERPVADWAWAVLTETIARTVSMDVGRRDHELATVTAAVMTGLNDWRTGARRMSWFADETKRITDGLSATSHRS